jgi:hypothetical protein
MHKRSPASHDLTAIFSDWGDRGKQLRFDTAVYLGGVAGCTDDGGEPKLLLLLGVLFSLSKKIETGKRLV